MDSSSEASEQSDNELVELEQQHGRIESENIASLSVQSKLFSPCQCILSRSLPSIAPKLYGPLVKLEKATNTSDESESYCLGNVYSLTFDGVEKPILAELDEEAVYRSIYCDERLFHAIGIEGCITVVESFYSVMKSQQCTGGQSNEVLALR